MTWTIPSFASVNGSDPNAKMICACGREAFADTLYDIRPLPPDKRIHSEDFVCAACVHQMSALCLSTRTELVKGHGAPAEVIAAAIAHDDYHSKTIKNLHPRVIAHMMSAKRKK